MFHDPHLNRLFYRLITAIDKLEDRRTDEEKNHISEKWHDWAGHFILRKASTPYQERNRHG